MTQGDDSPITSAINRAQPCPQSPLAETTGTGRSQTIAHPGMPCRKTGTTRKTSQVPPAKKSMRRASSRALREPPRRDVQFLVPQVEEWSDHPRQLLALLA